MLSEPELPADPEGDPGRAERVQHGGHQLGSRYAGIATKMRTNESN
jgi:hypothetical protein